VKGVVFLVMATIDHEVSDPIRAFTERADADTFRAACMEYHATFPPTPAVISDTQTHDAIWDEAVEAQRVWRVRHPAGVDGANAEHFVVYEVTLSESLATSTRRRHP